MFFSSANGNDQIPFEFRHPAELDKAISHGLESQSIFVRDHATHRLIVEKVVPEVVVNGKVIANELVVYKTRTLPGLVYGYAAAFMVEGSELNGHVVTAANSFKLAGHAREPYVTQVETSPFAAQVELIRSFHKNIQTLIGNMHGFFGKPDGPAMYCRSAVVFVDDHHYEHCERALALAHAHGGMASDKFIQIAGVRKRKTLPYESEEVA